MLKRELSSFDIFTITHELQKIKGYVIEKTYQISQSEIIIKIKNIKEKQKEVLFIRNGDFISLTKKDFKTPQKPSVFAMTLRKYLQNGRIKQINQHEFDRIIKIIISKKEGDYTLIIEFFSEGNIILLDPKNQIINPFIRQSWAHRKIKGREVYSPPPSQINTFNINFDDFIEIIRKSTSDIVRTIAVNLSLSGVIAEEICILSDVDKNKKINDLTEGEYHAIYNSLQVFLKKFLNKKFEPMLVKKESEYIDIIPFKFESYKNYNLEKTDKMIHGLEKFIIQKKQVKEEKKENKTDLEIGRLNRQLKQQKDTIISLKEKIDEKKNEGDLIYLHYKEIEKLLYKINKILDLKDKESEIKELKENDLVDDINLDNNILVLKLKDTDNNFNKVKINFRKTVSENADKSYKENKKLKSKLHGAEIALEKTNEKIVKMNKMRESEKKKEEELKEKEKIKKEKSFWFEKYRWFISSDDNIVIGGRDSKSNDMVVKKYLNPGDRYAHADIQGAPSIIIKSQDYKGDKTNISEKTLEEACIFAACNSKAWKQFAEAEAYWVKPEQVSKTPESGEFLPQGAFVIRGKRNYYRCKLELAVGLIEIDDTIKVMTGPISSVEKRTKKYVIIEPGGTKKSDIAKKIAKSFERSSDELVKVLPPGGISIVRSIGVDL